MVKRALVLLLLCRCAPSVSNPTTSAALSGPMEIVVDNYGWPHVFATSLKDAAFGQGYAMAVDRMAQMELFRRTSQGTLAEVYGSISGDFLKSDILFRTVGLRAAAENIWAATTERRSRDIFEGFSAGVNQYIDELRRGVRQAPLGSEVLLGQLKKPWTPVDSLTVLRLMEMFLTFNADAEIARTELASRVSPQLAAELMPFAPMSKAVTLPNFYAARSDFPKSDISRSKKRRPSSLRRQMSQRPARSEGLSNLAMTLDFLKSVLPPQNRLGMGTNTWAVSGQLAKNGHALLANDPHLPFTSPSILWGVHFVVTAGEDAVDITGVVFPGVPGVVFGHNPSVAWGMCNAMFDQMDVYEETVKENDVLFRGSRIPLDTRLELIPNGLGGALPLTVETVPHHGPVLPQFNSDGTLKKRTGSKAYSVKWVGHEVTHEVEGLLRLMYASNVDEAHRAVKAIETPPMGFVFVDSKGDIGFRMTAKVPVRPSNTRPAFVLPGTGEAEWQGYLEPDRLPHAERPAWIAAANNDPTGLSADGDPFNGPVYLGYDWAPGFRLERIQERLGEIKDGATIEQFQSIQSDHVLVLAKRLMPFLLASLEPGPLATKMAAWNFDATPTSNEATVFHSWLKNVADLAISDEIEQLSKVSRVQLTMAQRISAVVNALDSGKEASFWDDVRTPQKETATEILKKAVVGISEQKWGDVHGVRFMSPLPHVILTGGVDVAIPPRAEPAFPRGGGIESVDQAWPKLEDEKGNPADRYEMTLGPARRFTAEMTPTGPLTFDAIPGGESGDLRSKHFRDEAARWQSGERHPLPRTRDEVNAAAEKRMSFVPAN